MKRRTNLVISILLVVSLLIGVSLSVLADSGYGKASGKDMGIEAKISTSDWKVFYPALKNYIDQIKSLLDKQVEIGIISKYQAQGMKDELDTNFKNISKTRTIKVMPGYGGMGNMYGKNGNPMNGNTMMGNRQNKGNRPGYRNSQNMGGNKGYGYNYNSFKLTDSQWNSILPALKNVENAKNELYKAMLQIGLITQTQYDNIIKISKDNFNSLIDSKVVRPFFGMMPIIHMAD